MLKLNKIQTLALIKHSKKAHPKEACGLLAGQGSKVFKIYPVSNISKKPTRFLIKPEEQVKIMKEIEDLGLEMIGIYHSHTNKKAYPSDTDIKMAFYPEASYVIISLADKDNPEIKSFKIIEGSIKEEKIKII